MSLTSCIKHRAEVSIQHCCDTSSVAEERAHYRLRKNVYNIHTQLREPFW
jgi:hypothetical protein